MKWTYMKGGTMCIAAFSGIHGNLAALDINSMAY